MRTLSLASIFHTRLKRFGCDIASSAVLCIVREGQFKFISSESGAVAIPFGLMAVTLFMFIGAGLDVNRWSTARSKTISALDAAVLAGGRALQTNGGDQADAVQVATTYYNEAVKSRLATTEDTVSFKIDDTGSSVVASGSASIPTPFLSFAGIKSLPLIDLSGAESPSAILEVGQNAKTSFEISMILDTTGSMGLDGKLDDLKLAAKDLIEILVWDKQSQYTSKVALVPYATAVQVGKYADQIRGQVTGASCLTTGCIQYKYRNPYGKMRVNKADTCVTERTGPNAFTDASPESGGYAGINYSAANNPCLSGEILPLTNNKSSLNSRIDSLVAGGVSAGQIGVAWGWYMLSPNWGHLWPAASKPAAYGTANLRKIAVIMTDGEYNSAYCKNVISRDSTYGSGDPYDHIDCNATNGNSYDQALKLCTVMKASGISIYTVGFQVVDTPAARNFLSQCASDTASFYNAADGEALRASFRDIALKVSKLYLSK
ncbi:MAG: TadE/TadG family type IV pilus assembly protein [Hyphomicrobium sp.]